MAFRVGDDNPEFTEIVKKICLAHRAGSWWMTDLEHDALEMMELATELEQSPINWLMGHYFWIWQHPDRTDSDNDVWFDLYLQLLQPIAAIPLDIN